MLVMNGVISCRESTASNVTITYHFSSTWANDFDNSASERVRSESLCARLAWYFSIFQRTRVSSFCSGAGAVRGFDS